MPGNPYRPPRPLDGETILKLPASRNSLLPQYVYRDNHPFFPTAVSQAVGTVYIFRTSTDKEDLAWLKDQVRKRVTIPQGPDKDMPAHGLLQLNPGDAIFARPEEATDSTQDILQAVVAHSDIVLPQDKLLELIALRDEMIGTADQRRDGLTRIELDPRWIPTQSNRCSSTGFQTQRTKQRIAPAAATKFQGETDWGLDVRYRALSFFIGLGLIALKSYNPETYAILQKNADLKNIPALGHPDNCVWLAMQMNMASAVKYESLEGLKADMNEFGTEHTDQSDAKGGYTGMWASPFLNGHSNYEPGRFHLLELGAYIILASTNFLLFSGLRLHGGTPCRAPPGEEVDPNVTRFVVVLYPPSAAFNGRASYTMCAGPRQEAILQTPEHTNIDQERHEDRLWTNRANIAEDGPGIMPRISVVTVIVRFFVQLLVVSLRQLPRHFNIAVDTDKILEAVTFDDEHLDKDGNKQNVRTSLKPWANAPPVYGHNPDDYTDTPTASITDARIKIDREFREHSDRLGSVIPLCAASDLLADAKNKLSKQRTSVLAGGGGRPKGTTTTTVKKVITAVSKVRNRRSNNTQISGQSTARAIKTAQRAMSTLTRKHREEETPAPPSKRPRTRAGPSNQKAGSPLKSNVADEVESESDGGGTEWSVTGILSHRWSSKKLWYTVEWGCNGDDDSEPTEEPLKNLTPDDRTGGGCLNLLKKYHRLNGLKMKVTKTRGTPTVYKVSEDMEREEGWTATPAYTADVQGGLGPQLSDEGDDGDWVDEEPAGRGSTSRRSSTPEHDTSNIEVEVEQVQTHPSIDHEVDDEEEQEEEWDGVSDSAALSGNPFIKGLSISNISNTANAFILAQQEFDNIPTRHQSAEYLGWVTKTMDALAHCKTEESRFTTATQIYRGLAAATADSLVQTATLYLQRQLILLTRYYMFTSATQLVRTEARTTVWGKLLREKVGSVLSHHIAPRVESVVFNASVYHFPHSVQAIYNYERDGTQATRSRAPKEVGAEMDAKVESVMVQIVEHWLGLRATETTRVQRRFIQILFKLPLKVMAPIWLLPTTWDAYTRPAQSAVERRTGRSVGGSVSEAQWNALSVELHKVIELEDDIAEREHSLATLIALAESFTAKVYGQQSPTRALRGGSDTSDVAAASTSLTDTLTHPLLHFIKSLLPLLDRAPTTRLENIISKKPDARLPFREHAPNRRHVLSDQRFCRPLTDDALGLLRSLVINRGLTFNTEKVFDHGPWFDSPADWHSFRGTSVEDEHKYVNPAAYGRTNGRHSSNFDVLWTQSEALFNAITKGAPLGQASFVSVMELMRKDYHLKTFGSLTSLLLTEDMVYAGLVAMPSVHEFADEVSRVKMGAAKALKEMSLVPANASRGQVTHAFVEVFESLNKALSEEDKVRMTFDIFMVEHALCKLTRCKNWHTFLAL